MDAVVIGKELGGSYLKVRLWTGEVLRLHRGQIPWRGPVAIGERLDIAVKERKVVTRVRKTSDGDPSWG